MVSACVACTRRGAYGALLGVVFVLAPPAQASAHGRFPQSGLVAVDPVNAQRVVVRATYGFLTTEDAGQRWSWICPEAASFNGDNEDPAVAITADGSMLAGVFDGLSVTHDGCQFSLFGDELASRYFVDLAVDPSAQNVVALSANGLAANTYEVNLWSSSDAGHAFMHLGTSPPSDYLALTLGVAPSDPSRIYLTGFDGVSPQTAGALMRSDDGGTSWQRKPVPGSNADTLPFMGAVHRGDPNTVFIGLITTIASEITRFELLVTRDGGDTFTSAFQRDHGVPGFALSPDGSQIALGSDADGFWVGSSDLLDFRQVSTLKTRCITWTPDAIYACADQFVDGFVVGISSDEGATFAPFMELSSPCGPPAACTDSSTVGMQCTPRWPQEQQELGAADCDGASTGAAPTSTGNAAPGSEGSCSCRLPRRTDARAALAGVFAAIALAAMRRARRR